VTREAYLTTDELADRLCTSRGKIQNDRCRGKGPIYIKIGEKVLYPLSFLEAYERARLVDPAERLKRRQKGLPALRSEQSGARMLRSAISAVEATTAALIASSDHESGSSPTAVTAGGVKATPAISGGDNVTF
jgi:hypothetical protein